MTIQTHFYPSWLLDERQLSNITFLHAKSWLEDIFEEEYEDAYHFRTAILDGVLLCKLINTIEPGTITHVNVGKSPITWLENVNFFLEGCRKLGLLEYMLFDPYDLRFADDNEPELLRRNRNIAVTLFWLSRIRKACNLPAFGLVDQGHLQGEKDDLCRDCKSSADLSAKPADGKFTLLVEKSEESNDFGVTIKETDEGYPLITAVKHGSYAFKSGLHIGDYVITINGLNTNNMSVITVNNKIKSVFTEGHVYLGVCRLPPEEKLTTKHKESPLFKSRVPDVEDVPTIEVATVGTVQSAPPVPEPEAVPEWKKILERHKSERAQDDKNSEQVKELWNKYVKIMQNSEHDLALIDTQTDQSKSSYMNLALPDTQPTDIIPLAVLNTKPTDHYDKPKKKLRAPQPPCRRESLPPGFRPLTQDEPKSRSLPSKGKNFGGKEGGDKVPDLTEMTHNDQILYIDSILTQLDPNYRPPIVAPIKPIFSPLFVSPESIKKTITNYENRRRWTHDYTNFKHRHSFCNEDCQGCHKPTLAVQRRTLAVSEQVLPTQKPLSPLETNLQTRLFELRRKHSEMIQQIHSSSTLTSETLARNDSINIKSDPTYNTVATTSTIIPAGCLHFNCCEKPFKRRKSLSDRLRTSFCHFPFTRPPAPGTQTYHVVQQRKIGRPTLIATSRGARDSLNDIQLSRGCEVGSCDTIRPNQNLGSKPNLNQRPQSGQIIGSSPLCRSQSLHRHSSYLSNRDDIDDLLKEVGDFDINKAQKFKESVVQTDGNDSLNRNLTLVGHKLKRNVEHYTGVCGCCVQPLATFASIHLDNTPFTYHQMCFSCKHCGIGLIVEDALTHNVFIVDGMPYCDICIRKMGTIKFRKKNKKQMPQLTTV